MDTIQFVFCHELAIEPTQAYPGDVGWDLYSCKDQWILPDEATDIRTGIKVCLPRGTWGQITGRSSSFRKRGMLVIDGVIDAGFRGELFALCWNHTQNVLEIKGGERVAQFIIHEVVPIRWAHVGVLPSSERGEGGFGSSGV